MQTIGKYIFSIIAAALLVSVCKTILPSKSAVGSIFKVICGVLIATVVIAPLKDVRFDDLYSFYGSLQTDAEAFITEGVELTGAQLEESIKTRVSSYILDKATAMELCLEIEVMLTEDDIPLPEEVHIKGDASPYLKSQLTNTISNDLNIAEDKIQWN